MFKNLIIRKFKNWKFKLNFEKKKKTLKSNKVHVQGYKQVNAKYYQLPIIETNSLINNYSYV